MQNIQCLYIHSNQNIKHALVGNVHEITNIDKHLSIPTYSHKGNNTSLQMYLSITIQYSIFTIFLVYKPYKLLYYKNHKIIYYIMTRWGNIAQNTPTHHSP